jgi:hypothetical protein
MQSLGQLSTVNCQLSTDYLMILGDRATFCQRDYHKKMIRFSSRAGRMPTSQQDLVFVEQASCLFWKIVPDVSGGLEAHPTTRFSLCGTGILPVLENGA